MFNIKRVYLPSAKTDGYRVLVDRLWPRGLKKEKADVDLWLKEIAPSTELRKWFHHDTSKWTEFKAKYQEELAGNKAVDELIRLKKQHTTLTLLYAAKNEAINHAHVLLGFLEKELKP